MLKAAWEKYRLRFKFLARTSRNAMRVKNTYFLRVWNEENPEVSGIGECNLFKGLSADDLPDYEAKLDALCQSGLQDVPQYSSIIFGLETALANLSEGGGYIFFPSDWTKGTAEITINGLVWMGSQSIMLARIREKLQAGFGCVKLKIGGIDFDDEIELLNYIRLNFGPQDLELRLDANGAFSPADAMRKLDALARFSVHSIEQPIRQGQTEEMARICQNSPIPVALDEELIGIRSPAEKAELLNAIRPQYIILKPALCGAFSSADEWIAEAQRLGIGWWATSALESNIGLNAIAQWLASRHPEALGMPQGLGTGALYNNNVPCPIRVEGDKLKFYGN